MSHLPLLPQVSRLWTRKKASRGLTTEVLEMVSSSSSEDEETSTYGGDDEETSMTTMRAESPVTALRLIDITESPSSSSAPVTPVSRPVRSRRIKPRRKRSNAFLSPLHSPTLCIARDTRGCEIEGEALTDRTLACVKKVQRWTAEALVEAEIMNYLTSRSDKPHSEYVVKFYYETADPDTDRHVIAMEMTSLRNLGDVLGAVRMHCTRPMIAQLCLDVMRAIWFIHYCNIIHRNLRPEAFRLCFDGTRYVCKLGDFGSAKNAQFDAHEFSDLACDGIFSAPEVWEQKSRFPGAPDIWSLGLILCLFFSGRLPFSEKNFPAAICADPPQLEYPAEVLSTHYLHEIVSLCLDPDYRNRPSIGECLHMPFSTKHPVNSLDTITFHKVMSQPSSAIQRSPWCYI